MSKINSVISCNSFNKPPEFHGPTFYSLVFTALNRSVPTLLVHFFFFPPSTNSKHKRITDFEPFVDLYILNLHIWSLTYLQYVLRNHGT